MKDCVTNLEISIKLKEAGIKWTPRFGKKVWYKDKLMIVLRYQEMNVVGETLLKIVEDGTKETRFMPTFHEVKEKDIAPSFNLLELLAMVKGDAKSLANRDKSWVCSFRADGKSGTLKSSDPIEAVVQAVLWQKESRNA